MHTFFQNGKRDNRCMSSLWLSSGWFSRGERPLCVARWTTDAAGDADCDTYGEVRCSGVSVVLSRLRWRTRRECDDDDDGFLVA